MDLRDASASKHKILETTWCLHHKVLSDTILCLTLHIRWGWRVSEMFLKGIFDVINLSNDPPLKGSGWGVAGCVVMALLATIGQSLSLSLSLSLVCYYSLLTTHELGIRTLYIEIFFSAKDFPSLIS